MELLRITGRRCSILLSEQVIDVLNDWASAKEPKNAMISLLTRSVPDHGPPPVNTSACAPIGNGIFEFRKNEKRGAKVRVLWFYGEDAKNVVVCAVAFVKTFPKTPPEDIAFTEAFREQYFNAIRTRTLHIEDGSDLLRKKKR